MGEKRFMFEIQDSIKVVKTGKTAKQARDKVLAELARGFYEVDEDGNVIVSEGVEIGGGR